ncbi:MAG: branched-chain amino acid ABC transporter permease [Desulfobulbaceae bacterium]|jgi:branched-chain amino acid transport system permease protein|nr:branched-chain amino acid ABC transporter permease [Desulfobulbaceae bacterium]
MFWQFLFNGFVTGCLYSLAAVGFALVYNTTHIFHIAAAGVYTAAAYFFYFAAKYLGVAIIPAALAALLFAAFFNVACEIFVYRPLSRRNASSMVVMLASIGSLTIIVNVIAMLFGNETKIIDSAIASSFRLGSLIISQPQAWQLFVSAAMLAVFVIWLRQSTFGLKARALGNNSALFAVFGFDAARTRLGCFALGGVFLGAASCLSAYDIGLSPHGGMPVLLNAMVAMIIGGVGRFFACIAGGILLGVLQALVVWQFAANWQNAVTFTLLIVFLFFRPSGLFGSRTRAV